MPFLVTRLINVTGVFLYPAYASYKALQARPLAGPDAQAQVERWLQYWAVVGAWATVEGAVGFLWSWIPFYTIIKTLVFLYLTLPSPRAAPYVYNTILAPLFAEHEPAIDAFLGDIRAKTTGAAGGTLGWLWETVRKALGLTQDQAAYAAHAAGWQGPPPGAGAAPPPYAQRPGPPPPQQQGNAGAGAFGALSGLAKQYLPGAIAAASSALGATGAAQNQGYRVPNVAQRSFAAGADTPSAPAGSQGFPGEADTSALSAQQAAQRSAPAGSRTPSDASLASGSGSAANLRASGYDEIRREEAEGATPPEATRRASSSSWLKWGGAAAPPGAGKDKAE